MDVLLWCVIFAYNNLNIVNSVTNDPVMCTCIIMCELHNITREYFLIKFQKNILLTYCRLIY